MMTNEETFLKERLGCDNHFRVPEGYFEQLTQQVMQQLPERQPRKSKLVTLRPWLYAAACVVVLLVMSVTLLMPQQGGTSEPAVMAVATTTTTNSQATDNQEYMDDAADYAMLDNVDIYACLMEN